MKLFLVAVFLGIPSKLICAQTPGTKEPTALTLDRMRDTFRPVLVFAPSNTPQLQSQLRIFSQDSEGLRQRDVIVFPVLPRDHIAPWSDTVDGAHLGQLTPTEQTAARLRFHIAPNAFAVILVGKDGGEKLRSTQPISIDTLRSTIDAMPMRQEEMRHPPPH